jgi:hypothetical protein
MTVERIDPFKGIETPMPTADRIASVEAHLVATEARNVVPHAHAPGRAKAARQRAAQVAQAETLATQCTGACPALTQQVAAIRARLLVASTDLPVTT